MPNFESHVMHRMRLFHCCYYLYIPFVLRTGKVFAHSTYDITEVLVFFLLLRFAI